MDRVASYNNYKSILTFFNFIVSWFFVVFLIHEVIGRLKIKHTLKGIVGRGKQHRLLGKIR